MVVECLKIKQHFGPNPVQFQRNTTSEQHKDLTEARIKRDTADLEKISEKLAGCSPYSSDLTLRNIIIGIVAQECVNVHEHESVAQNVFPKNYWA